MKKSGATIAEKYFEGIFNIAESGIVIVDWNGIIRRINPAFTKVLGYEEHEIVEVPFYKIVYKNQYAQKILAKSPLMIFHNSDNMGREYTFFDKQGRKVPVRFRSSLIKEENGQVLKAIGMIESIKEINGKTNNQRLLSEKMEELKHDFESIVKNSADAIVICDINGMITMANRSFLQMVGYPDDEVIGSHIAEFTAYVEGEYTTTAEENIIIDYTFIESTVAKNAELFYKGYVKNLESYLVRKDKRHIPIEATMSLLKDKDDECRGTLIIIRDVTEFRKAKKSLQETKDFLENIFNTTEDGIIASDNNGYITKVNDAVETITGYSKDELLKQHISIFLSSDKKLFSRPDKKKLIKDGKLKRVETIFKRNDGDYVIIESNMSVLRDKKGELIGCVSVNRDITDRKQAEEEKRELQAQLDRAEKMETIGTMASGVAHDLNNVLGAIIGYPELMLEEIPQDSPLRRPILEIKKSGERGAAIVQDLLTLARRRIEVTDVCNFNSIVKDYLGTREFRKMKEFHPGVHIETNFAVDLLNISGSPVHLSKAVMNLVSNAAEALPAGGVIVISTENTFLDKPVKGYEKIKEGQYVVISVADNGVGITEADLQKIFEPFYTKKVMGRSGTGLGMAIVWGTVKDHKGYIDVESTVGMGTTFKIYIPVTRKEIGAKATAVPIGRYVGNGEKILVIDDVASQREVTSKLLRKLNYSVETVASGEEAVEYMETVSADLLVLDMIMDPGIDGLETYKTILKKHPEQKAIITSGFSDTDRVKEAQRLGAGAYVKKPHTLETLGIAVKNELEKGRVCQQC